MTAREINKYVRENSIDIINFHGAKAFLVHKLFKKFFKIPTLATVHSDYRYDFLNNRLKYILFTPLSKLGVKSFDNFACVSRYIKGLLESEGINGRKIVISNGIDTKDRDERIGKKHIRKSLGISEDVFVFVIVARLHPVKNHELLINAFHKLTKEYEDIKLIIVGDGELRSKLINQVDNLNIKNKVIFTGFREDSIDIVRECNISLLTSLSEGGAPPLVVLESAIMKTPIISTKVGDIEEVIDNSMGFIIESNAENEIYKKLKEAYIKKEELKQMGEAFYNKVVTYYSMERFISSYYSFYKSIIENKR